MAQRRRELIAAVLVAVVSWLAIGSWAPLLRYLGYAFIAGVVAGSFILVALVLLSLQSSVENRQDAFHRPPGPIFTTPKAWPKESRYFGEHRLYAQKSIYPASFLVSQSIDGILDLVYKTYITSWYQHIARNGSFVNEIDRPLRAALTEIRIRLLEQDVIEALVLRIVPLVTRHLGDFYEAERAVRGINLNRNVTESEELDLAIASKYRDGVLHPAASLKFSDLKATQQEYLRRTIVRILPLVLSETALSSRAVSVLIKEMVSCAVLYPLMQMLSDPDTWNRAIEIYGRSILQDRKTVRKLRAALDQHASPAPRPSRPTQFPRLARGDDERKFERFIRSIRQCSSLSDARRFRSEVASQLKKEYMVEGQDKIYLRRLERGKQLLDQRVGKLSALGAANANRTSPSTTSDHPHAKSQAKPVNADLREVLYDAAGLSYFMEFMDRRRLMTLVQFWIVVDGFRNPLEDDAETEDPFTHRQTYWTDADCNDLAQIDEAYLSKPELKVSDDSRDTIRDFLKSGSDATMAQYVRARASVLRAQSATYLEMDEVHFPAFKTSDLFFKYLTADDTTKAPSKPAKHAVKEPTISSIPESPGKPTIPARLINGTASSSTQLTRNASSSSDLKSSTKLPDNLAEPRRSLDIDNRAPLFDDDLDTDRMSRSLQSLDADSANGDQTSEDQDQMVNAMEAALTDIMTNKHEDDDARPEVPETSQSSIHGKRLFDSPRSSGEFKRSDMSALDEKDKDRPSIASLGLVKPASRIGVFRDDDLFGDEEKFLEDELTDSEHSADEKPVDQEIHQAAPGDLGLAEAISALTSDIDRLSAQESVVDTLTRKAELTNNVAELRILSKSKSSLQRELRRKELQRQQYIVQESDNSLFGRANVHIKSIMVGREEDGQDFALYVIEVQRNAGEHMPAASWAIARRYSEFHDLHQRLRQLYPAVRQLEFPRRRLVMKLQRDFLHKRRVSLERYLRQLLQLPAVCRSRDLRAFLSQSAIVSTQESSPEGEQKDIISRIYNSVTDGMEEFLGNVPVLDQLSLAGQNLISAAASQFTTMSNAGYVGAGTSSDSPLPIAPEDPIQTDEARAELLAFDPAAATIRTEQVEPFVKPICDLFLETFDLRRGNNWLRGRAVVVVLHQLLGGTVERKVRDGVKSLFEESAVVKYLQLFRDTVWPSGVAQSDWQPRVKAEKNKTKVEAAVTLGTLVPDLAGSVVGKANAQAASRRLSAAINNQRLTTHLAFVVFDELVDILFPRDVQRR